MATIVVTTRVEIEHANGNRTVFEEIQRSSAGDNPLFHVQGVEKVARRVWQTLRLSLVNRYGEVDTDAAVVPAARS